MRLISALTLALALLAAPRAALAHDGVPAPAVAAAAGQQTVVVTDPTQHALGFYYVDADVAAYGVVRFEIQYDAAAWTSIGMTKITDPQTPQGSSAYEAAFPALTQGAHTAVVRACTATGGCSGPSAPFAFTVSITPTSPVGLHLIAKQ